MRVGMIFRDGSAGEGRSVSCCKGAAMQQERTPQQTARGSARSAINDSAFASGRSAKASTPIANQRSAQVASATRDSNRKMNPRTPTCLLSEPSHHEGRMHQQQPPNTFETRSAMRPPGSPDTSRRRPQSLSAQDGDYWTTPGLIETVDGSPQPRPRAPLRRRSPIQYRDLRKPRTWIPIDSPLHERMRAASSARGNKQSDDRRAAALAEEHSFNERYHQLQMQQAATHGRREDAFISPRSAPPGSMRLGGGQEVSRDAGISAELEAIPPRDASLASVYSARRLTSSAQRPATSRVMSARGTHRTGRDVHMTPAIALMKQHG